MPLYKADIIVVSSITKAKDAYPIDIDAYTSAKDIAEATNKFAKYALSKKGKVEAVYALDERNVLV